jgi:hypothetical protein
METETLRPPYTTAEKVRVMVMSLVLAMVLLVPAIVVPALLARSSGLHLPGSAVKVAQAATHTTTHLSFDVLPVRPGGPPDNWPAYVATSPTALPANTVVTVTIRNFDVGDDTLPAGSPILRVQGTTNAVAYADGKAYSGLDAAHISHSFTIMQLDLSVPIPGDAVGDANHVTVTFTFRTPAKAGTYTFQCFVPCGTGSSGFDGPMNTLGFMRGTVTVVA